MTTTSEEHRTHRADLGLPLAVRAQGARIYDADGKDYIDGSSGPICVNIGHGRPEVLEAIQKQAQQLCFVHRSQFANSATAALSAEILAMMGVDFREVVFTNSGSEATETALRLALHHHALRGEPHRTAVLTQYPSYHGMTAGALGISGHPPRRQNLSALVNHQMVSVRVEASSPDTGLPDVDDWQAAFDKIGAGRIAAVMIEPVGGAASGAAEVTGQVMRRLADLCAETGVLLIADEVMSGFGRTGDWFGFDKADVRPDLVVTGKGLSSGYTPIGACIVGRDVLAGSSASDIALGHTMSGNPLSAATALAVLRFTREHDLAGRARAIGAQLKQDLARLAEGFSFLGVPRGRGLLIGLPVMQTPAEFTRSPLAARVCSVAREHGLLLYPAGVDAASQAILVAPPLTIDAAELAALAERLSETLRVVEAELAVMERTK